jgi:hypothetical protein
LRVTLYYGKNAETFQGSWVNTESQPIGTVRGGQCDRAIEGDGLSRRWSGTVPRNLFILSFLIVGLSPVRLICQSGMGSIKETGANDPDLSAKSKNF